MKGNFLFFFWPVGIEISDENIKIWIRRVRKRVIIRVRSAINDAHVGLIGTLGDQYTPIMVTCGSIDTSWYLRLKH